MTQDVPGPDDARPPAHEPQAYPSPVPPPFAMTPPPVVTYPEESQAVLSLVLSLVGLIVCGGLLCPVGWYLGNKELAGIDNGRRDPTKRDLAMAGKIVGIIGTVLVVLGIVAFVGFVALALVLGTTA